MESDALPPTAGQAATAVGQAESGPLQLAGGIAAPRLFFAPIAVAIAFQIGTTAAGLAGAGQFPGWLLASGFAGFVVVSVVQLARFRRLNGIWLWGLVNRVFGGTAVAASLSYCLALGGAIWAAFVPAWWLVVLCASVGGAAYAMSAVAWMRAYRLNPAAHNRGESAAWLGVMLVLAVTGAALLLGFR